MKPTNKPIWLLVFVLCLLLVPSSMGGSFQPKPPRSLVVFDGFEEKDTFDSPMVPLTLTETTTEYVYSSSLGTYAFNKSDVKWSFTTRSGILLSPSTRFTVQFLENMFWNWIDLDPVTVNVEASQTSLHYSAVLQHTFGTVDVWVKIYASSPPKFTLTFDKNPLGFDTRIVWKTTVPQAWRYFTTDMKTVTDWNSGLHERQVDRVAVMNVSSLEQSKVALVVDWQDFGVSTVQLRGSTISVFFPTNQIQIDPTLYNYYDTGDNADTWAYGTWWLAQPFDVSTSYFASIVGVKLWRSGLPGMITISIQSDDGGGYPSGVDLVTNSTLDGNTLTATTPGQWYNFTFAGGGVQLSGGSAYHIVLRATAGTILNRVNWRADNTWGLMLISLDSGATWSGAAGGYQSMHRVYGEGFTFNFVGLLWEDTGLLKEASQRATNVTAHFIDNTLDDTFEVNGTYLYTTSNEVQYFSFNISSSANDYVISQYGLNLFIYNNSASYDILFSTIEPDTNYYVNASLSWQSTYTISSETTTGCTITFGTNPNQSANYLNYYVYRTSTTLTERTREYWVSSNEVYGGTIYIFDGTFTTYDINFLDLAGVLKQYPHVAAKRYINGTLMIVEKRKVDDNNHIIMNLINGRKYTFTIENSATVYTWGDVQTFSTTTIQLILRGVDFPKETLLTYKNVIIYGYRTFNTPNGTITIWYTDLLNETTSVAITIMNQNGTIMTTSTQTTPSWSYTWTDAANDTTYRVQAIITHGRYGVMTWKQIMPYEIEAGTTLSLGWLGNLQIDTSIIIPSFIIILVAGCFSVINAEVGAILACIVAAALTAMRLIAITPGFIITAFFLAFSMALVYAKRRVSYG